MMAEDITGDGRNRNIELLPHCRDCRRVQLPPPILPGARWINLPLVKPPLLSFMQMNANPKYRELVMYLNVRVDVFSLEQLL